MCLFCIKILFKELLTIVEISYKIKLKERKRLQVSAQIFIQ